MFSIRRVVPIGRPAPSFIWIACIPYLVLSAGARAAPMDGAVPVSGALTLRRALEAALEFDPELRSLEHETEARAADARQANARLNPELALDVENAFGSGAVAGATETTVSLVQTLERGGKRPARAALAAAALRRNEREGDVRRNEVLAATTRSFVAVVAAQERVALAGETLRVAEAVLEAVARRVRAGAASAVEESRAKVELETLRIELRRRDGELRAARRDLTRLWGAAEPRFDRAVARLDDLPPLPDADSLAARYETGPLAARARAAVAEWEAGVATERSRGYGDLSLGVGVRYHADARDRSLVFGAAIPLPVFDRNAAAWAAARARVRAAEESLRGESVGARAALAVAVEEAATAAAEVATLTDVVLPEAERAFDAARAMYERGLLRLTDVLDAERSLFELRGRRLDALARGHTAASELERLIGEPLDGGLRAKETLR